MKTIVFKVYIHIFPNGKRYVGLTKTDLNRRWQGGKGYRTQPLIYRAILKYGWKNIVHQVFECDTEAEMKYLERYLIAYYNTTDHRYGYNISTGGEYAHSGVPSKNRKAIDQYDRQGHFIKTWESITAIEKELNYNSGTICNCLKKRTPTAFTFYWCYSGEAPEFKTYRTQRKVYQYSLTGELIAEFKTASEAGRNLGKEHNLIASCCNGKCKTAYNYIWKYEC